MVIPWYTELVAAYNDLSIKAKRRLVHERANARPLTGSPPIPCPACSTQVLPHELTQAAHGMRCPAAWLLLSEAREAGARWGTLCGWIVRGQVRRRKRGARWIYSAFDVLLLLGELELARRRRRAQQNRMAARERWRMHGPSRHADTDGAARHAHARSRHR